MTVAREYAVGSLTPDAGASAPAARVRAQLRHDVAATLRNGEQLLLTMIIPLVLLVALSLFDVLGSGGVAEATPSIVALAVMSTAFTSLAIGTGFDRRSGALKLLGTTPLTRGELVTARVLSVLVIEVVQVAAIVVVALLLGWRPDVSPAVALPATVLLVVLGTAAFGTWAVVMAGALRAEATLAAANGVYLLLMLGGGVVVPQESLPGPWAAFVSLLPSGALAQGLRDVLLAGTGIPWRACLVLLVWAVAGFAIARRTFRWGP